MSDLVFSVALRRVNRSLAIRLIQAHRSFARGGEFRDYDGFDIDGYDKDGFDRDGVNRLGFDRNGNVPIPETFLVGEQREYHAILQRLVQINQNISKYGIFEDDDGFGPDGFDKDGYDRDGLDRDCKDRNGEFYPVPPYPHL